jgi:serine/threonine-protein kinase
MIGQTIDGRYQLARQLGEGGMGAVYEARHTGTGKRVAVKLIKGPVSEVLVERFAREARAVGALETQHVAHVFDIGTDAGTGMPYIVMELLGGEDLSSLLDRRGRLPEDLVLRIVAQACVGLAKAHALGIVHRDIKPANLFLASRDGGERVVKILDFGVAKFRPGLFDRGAEGLTVPGTVVGTPHYASPEQARSQPDIDGRTDVWSLGAVMYRAFAGRAPFAGGQTIAEMLAAILHEPLPPLAQHAPWVSAETIAIVERALHKSAEHRFASIEELGRAVAARLPHGMGIVDAMLEGAIPAHEQTAATRVGAPAAATESAVPFVVSTLPSPGAPARVATAAAAPEIRSRRGLVVAVVGAVLAVAIGGAAIFVSGSGAPRAETTTTASAIAPTATASAPATTPPVATATVSPPTVTAGDRKVELRGLRVFGQGDDAAFVTELHNAGQTPVRSPGARLTLLDARGTKLVSGSCQASGAVLQPGATVACGGGFPDAKGWTTHVVDRVDSAAVRGEPVPIDLVVHDLTLQAPPRPTAPHVVEGLVENRGAVAVRVRVFVALYGVSGELAGAGRGDVAGEKLEAGARGRFVAKVFDTAEPGVRAVAMPMRLDD